MRSLGTVKTPGYLDASRTLISGGRLRDIVSRKRTWNGRYETDQNKLIDELPSTGQSNTPEIKTKQIPGPVVAAIPKAVIDSSVFISTMETSYPEQTGHLRRYSGNILHVEPLDKPFYRLDPVVYATGSPAPIRDIQVMLHLPHARLVNLARIGLGAEGISNPADRVGDKDKIVYGGVLRFLVSPAIYPNIPLYQSIAGQRAQQRFIFSAPSHVSLSTVRYRRGDFGRFVVPGRYDGGQVHQGVGEFRLKASDIDTNGRTNIQVWPETDRMTLIRIPWRLDLDITFNGGWTTDPETLEQKWVATGGYSILPKFIIGPGDVTA